MSERVSERTPQDTTPQSGAELEGVPATGREAESVAAHAVDLVAPTEALQSDPGLTEGFKSAFGQHPAGIAIITVAGPEGPVGLTASSVSSISADPPILGFSLQAKRGSAAVVATADSFIVHFLDSDNVELARSFAISGAPRFGEDMAWETLPTGEPGSRVCAACCAPFRWLASRPGPRWCSTPRWWTSWARRAPAAPWCTTSASSTA